MGGLLGEKDRDVRRYRIPPDAAQDDNFLIEGDVFHHIVDVCRQGLGSKFELLDDAGFAHLVEITELQKKRATAHKISSRELPRPRKPHIHLALSVPRFNVLEDVLEKAVELGVTDIHLFFSKFSFVRDEDKISPSKWERWKKIVLSSTQQSGRADLMRLHAPIPLENLLTQINLSGGDWGLMAYEGSTKTSVSEALAEASKNAPHQSLDRVWAFIGSEGGFSESEAAELESKGLKAATLGDQVLRVETACITMVSVLKYEFGHF